MKTLTDALTALPEGLGADFEKTLQDFLKKWKAIQDKYLTEGGGAGVGGIGDAPFTGAASKKKGIPKPRIVGIKEAWKQMVTGILGGQGTPTDRNTKELVVQAKLTNKEIRLQRKEIKEALRQPGTRAAWALP